MAIDEKCQTELRLGLVLTPVVLGESNGGELFQMCASSNMAVYTIEMTKLEVNGDWLHYSQEALNFSVRMRISL